ncbi:MAG TPA: Spx/MgsR family RNA polymerase-binding regulatory protein [Caldithrix abyssi]|uniref:Spx/MgsR family RNA polymerase-binding regulatory protein n=1 Tax=Caldithrix abyssi TaxID=187145 RepID=A0A7V1LKQ5_CALAY|nr:Spx/MgsR family RNA polymerase-binding regulatory protein [Caldithrix abyssi]
MLTLYGIPNCDTIRKTKKFLEKHTIPYHFVDVRKTPLPAEQVKEICDRLGLTKVVNSRGQTYRKLGIKEKQPGDDQLFNLLVEEQAMIKRPLLKNKNNYFIGYDEQGLLEFARLADPGVI